MSTTTSGLSSSFVGGSNIIAIARETAAADEVLAAFQGSVTPIAQAAIAVALEVRDGDPLGEAQAHFQGYRFRSTLMSEAVQALVAEADGTPEVEAVQAPATVSAPTINLTAEWMKVHYTEVFTMLVQHLSAKMTRSRDLCVVEDHVQRLITRLIEKDQLAPLLTKGENPKLSVLRVWAYQSACTELRRWGVDASLRSSRAAKTSREVQQGKAWRVIQSADTAREVIHEDESASDLYDPSASSPEDTMAHKSRLAQVRKALIRMGRADLIPVMNGLVEGQSLTDLRATFGAPADQLGSVIGSLRV